MRNDMSYYAPENDSTVIETPPRRGRLLGALQSSFRAIQGHLGINGREERDTPPPSYEDVLQQKRLGCNSPIRKGSVEEYLEVLDAKPQPPSLTARRLEMVVEKRLTALFANGTDPTPEWARRNPIAVSERIRHFLTHCIACESGLDRLVPLSQSDRKYFYDLAKAYERSWTHQVMYGWDKTPQEVQTRASDMFDLLIENPSEMLGLHVHILLAHLSYFISFCDLPQGSSLIRRPLLRMNDKILDAVVNPGSRVYKILKRKMEAELPTYASPPLSNNRPVFAINEDLDWTEFISINCSRPSKFAPLRRREYEDEGRLMDENARSSSLPEIMEELESNPWA